MIIVIDTNVAVSGLLWGGPPNQILRWARDGVIRILACGRTVDELKRVLHYRKFAGRLSALQTTPQEALAYALNLLNMVPNPESIPAAIENDPFDNLFLALALENRAALIASGDRHLLDLESFKHIQIVTPSEAVQVTQRLSSTTPS